MATPANIISNFLSLVDILTPPTDLYCLYLMMNCYPSVPVRTCPLMYQPAHCLCHLPIQKQHCHQPLHMCNLL